MTTHNKQRLAGGDTKCPLSVVNALPLHIYGVYIYGVTEYWSTCSVTVMVQAPINHRSKCTRCADLPYTFPRAIIHRRHPLVSCLPQIQTCLLGAPQTPCTRMYTRPKATTTRTCWFSSCAPPALASSPGPPGEFPGTDGSFAVDSRKRTLDDSFLSSSVSLTSDNKGCGAGLNG